MEPNMENEAFINIVTREGESIAKIQKPLDLNLTLSSIMVVHLSIKLVNINPKQGGSQ